MTTQVRSFELTVPAGTAKDSPVSLPMSFPPMTVTEITVTVPPGPNGHLGIQIAAAGAQVIPWNAGEFLVPNDVVMTWQPVGYSDAGSWSLIGYNTGTHDHTVWVRFNLTPVEIATPTPTPTLIPADQLSVATSTPGGQ